METERKRRKISAFKSPKTILTLRDFFSLPLKFYGRVGIKIIYWDDYNTMTKWEMLKVALIVLNVSFGFFCKVTFIIVEEFESTVQMTQWNLYLSFATDGFFRMLSVVWGRKTLNRVLKTLERLFPRSAKECQEFKIEQGYKYIHHHTRIMVYIHLTIAYMFLIFPLVQSTVEYKESGVFVQRLPYILSYPFDTSPIAIYIIVYASQFLGGLTVSYFILGSDTLLVHSVYLVILNFEYLCFRIERFEPKDREHDMAEIKFILEMHYLLNDLVQAINSIFCLSILFNYMMSIMMIVMLGVQIITGPELLGFIKFVGFLISATIQVFYFSFISSLLKERSSNVGESIMGQKWYMTDVRYQRMLTLAIARSQRPAHLTAFKFFMVSMESFSNLMTTAYQFFTLLKTRMEEGVF